MLLVCEFLGAVFVVVDLFLLVGGFVFVVSCNFDVCWFAVLLCFVDFSFAVGGFVFCICFLTCWF